MTLPIAVSSAILMCNKGTALTPLGLSGSSNVRICDFEVATISDTMPGLIIAPFGKCTITNEMCSPIPVGQWKNPFDSRCIVGNKQALLQGATLKCENGGNISVMLAAQALALIFENLPKAYRSIEDVANFITEQMLDNLYGSDAREINELLRGDDDGIFSLFTNVDNVAKGLNRFRQMVDYGRPWDYKSRIWNQFGGEWTYDPKTRRMYSFDIWSNIHYGYIGAAVGIPPEMLSLGAHGAQLAKTQHLDQSYDQYAIDLGVGLWKSRHENITSDEIIDSVRNNANNLNTKK
ncbi:polymorphic toxin type 44 domain-containing protein [Sorangium sp. So ce291]|uniref:polymorphic toxin type 44 domain-containing protein n=1 Tax=Sorangium sp. So ce291 TaxID=3133294 RepID=UPI003F64288E